MVLVIIRIEIAWLSGHHFVGGGGGDAAYDAVDADVDDGFADDADDDDDDKDDGDDGDDDDIA